jgi:hypothetical protein
MHTEIIAHHALLLAIPAFVPAVAVVGVVLWIAVRDRRSDGDAPENVSENVSEKERNGE